MEKKTPSQADINEAMGILKTPESSPEDRKYAEEILKYISPEKKRLGAKEMKDYEPAKNMAKGGSISKSKKMISEYGGMEQYTSKAAMKKHEKVEGPMMESKEGAMFMKSKKMAMGGKVGRGCGSSMRGGGAVMKYGKKGF